MPNFADSDATMQTPDAGSPPDVLPVSKSAQAGGNPLLPRISVRNYVADSDIEDDLIQRLMQGMRRDD